ncbi:MAG: UDP-N-acetylmuramoyl-L-alanine--D-glutamate ligase [Candidatus Omnitrophica bacterium]|nr:UDP-N-acetylmuramoyl-L-alanine--D-glutamate ligase [Candidatus Omnitrophota bacterium]
MTNAATIVGLGISGFGAALLLGKKGWGVRVTEQDDSPEIKEKLQRLIKRGINIKFEIGRHTRDFIKGVNLVITSPGVANTSKPLMWAKELNIPIIDEIELGYRFCPARIVAVTGTNGKSTTTTLIGEILKKGGYNAVICGNIGHSFCEKSLGLKEDDIIVLEVSSFQLQRINEFRPYVSVFMNITQNHFDRHKDFKEYLNAKLNIFKNQRKTDWAVLNYDDKNLKGIDKNLRPNILYFGNSPTPKGAFIKDGAIYVDTNGRAQRLFYADELPLRGEHNLQNYMAAILVGLIFKVEPEVMRKVLKNFKGLGHRCEFITEIEGVRFVNDSKATTVDATMHAIRSLDGAIVLIAGGRDKGSDFTVLRGLIEERVKAIILIGEAKAKIKTQLLGTAPLYEARDLKEAVQIGFNVASKSDFVLLSPMCASFDMFKNFEERGNVFKKAIKLLKEGTLKKRCKIQQGIST